MLEFADGFEVLGVYCYPVPDQGLRYCYLPLSADSQRGADGKAAAQLIAAGDTAFLQLSTVWDVPAARLEEVRRAVADRVGQPEPALVVLAFAPVTVDAVRLMSGDGAEVATELATARSSGLAPHSALFSLPLRDEPRERALAAFNGRTGFLQVRYEATLPAPVRHRARLTGDLSGIATAGELEVALAEGRAALEIDPADAALRDAFLLRTAEILRLLEPADGEAEVLIEVVVTESVALGVMTDVGSWFEAGGSAVLPVAGPGFDPAPEPDGGAGELTVSLDLPGVEEVVADVEVESGEASGRLAPPRFDPVTLPRADATAAVRVRTSYAVGGAGFETERAPEDGRLALAAGDLGLLEVTLDAGPLVERGLDRLRTTVRYRPQGPGERSERTFHLREPPFSARWLLISRGEPVGESLTYDLRATLASGESLHHGPVVSLSPTITLEANPEE